MKKKVKKEKIGEGEKSFWDKHKVKIIIIVLILIGFASNQKDPDPYFEIEAYTSSCIDACAEECRDKGFSDGMGECLSCGYWKTNLEYKRCDCHCYG